MSYVEFQKNYRSLMEYHKAALEATRDLWRLVMRETVPVRGAQRRLQRIQGGRVVRAGAARLLPALTRWALLYAPPCTSAGIDVQDVCAHRRHGGRRQPDVPPRAGQARTHGRVQRMCFAVKRHAGPAAGAVLAMACWHTHALPPAPRLGCRYPRNAKLLRSYGRFLENVKNDPWTAAKYYAEAEKQARAREGSDFLVTPLECTTQPR